jgi:hypothetical protein
MKAWLGLIGLATAIVALGQSSVVLFFRAPAAEASSFDPSQISTLRSWVRSSDMANGATASWTDRTGNGFHWIQATGSKQPVNSAAGMYFDGVDDSLRCDGLAASIMGGTDAQHTIFIVYQTTNTTATTRTFLAGGSSASANQFNFYRISTNRIEASRRGDSESTAKFLYSNRQLTTNVNILTIVSKEKSTAIRINGTNVADYIPRDNTSATTVNQLAMGMLVRTTESAAFQGYILEMLVCSNGISDSLVYRTEQFLSDFYGRPILSGGETNAPDRIYDMLASWWAQPQAVTISNKVYAGGSTSHGTTVVGELGGTGQRYSMHWYDVPDDHNTVSVFAPTNKPPVMFSFNHNGGEEFYYRFGQQYGVFVPFSTNKTKSAGVNIDYVQAHKSPTGDVVFAFCRVQNTNWGVFVSTNFCTNFNTLQRWLDFGVGNQGYMIARPLANGTLRVAAYGHPTSSSIRDIRYCHIDTTNGNVLKLDGTVLANLLTASGLPLAFTNLDLVYNPPAAEGTRLFDISDGPNIEIAYATWTNTISTKYRYALYNGASWVHKDIVAAGTQFGYEADVHYQGAMDFPDTTPGGQVVLSRETNQVWQVEKWFTADSGDTWTAHLYRSSTGTNKYVRPVALGTNAPYPVLFFDVARYGTNDVNSYTNFLANLRGISSTP